MVTTIQIQIEWWNLPVTELTWVGWCPRGPLGLSYAKPLLYFTPRFCVICSMQLRLQETGSLQCSCKVAKEIKASGLIPPQEWMPLPRVGGWVYWTARVGLQKCPSRCFYCSHDALKGIAGRITWTDWMKKWISKFGEGRGVVGVQLRACKLEKFAPKVGGFCNKGFGFVRLNGRLEVAAWCSPVRTCLHV